MVTRGALLDELSKIAKALTPEHKEENSKKLKKWGKNTAIIAGGTALGQVAGMGADHLLEKKFGKAPKSTRMKYLGPALGAVTAAGSLAAMHFKNKQEEAQRE
jgi:hypothetical protein